MKFNPLPSQERLKEVLNYDPDTGVFTWKVSTSHSVKAGSVAGSTDRDGYIQIRLDRVYYRAHRLAWLHYYGEDPGDLEIDHIEHNRSDNRISKLRLATASQNQRNGSWQGIGWHDAKSKWRARIKVSGKSIFLGWFDCPLLARLAYLDARKQYFGEFA